MVVGFFKSKIKCCNSGVNEREEKEHWGRVGCGSDVLFRVKMWLFVI
jgi:hypothetical protein